MIPAPGARSQESRRLSTGGRARPRTLSNADQRPSIVSAGSSTESRAIKAQVEKRLLDGREQPSGFRLRLCREDVYARHGVWLLEALLRDGIYFYKFRALRSGNRGRSVKQRQTGVPAWLLIARCRGSTEQPDGHTQAFARHSPHHLLWTGRSEIREQLNHILRKLFVNI